MRHVWSLLSDTCSDYARWLLALPMTHATSGCRAYRASMVDRIDLPSVRAEGYGFQIEMAYRIVAAGGAIAEVPITFVDRERGRSKMSARIIGEALLLVTWWGVRDRLAGRARRWSRDALRAPATRAPRSGAGSR